MSSGKRVLGKLSRSAWPAKVISQTHVYQELKLPCKKRLIAKIRRRRRECSISVVAMTDESEQSLINHMSGAPKPAMAFSI